MDVEKVEKGKSVQKFTGQIINNEDYIVNIHGNLTHQNLPSPKGHKKIDIEISEKKKVKDKGKEVEKIVNVAVLRLLLDESNHCIEAHVEDIITGGKSITIHNKTTSELHSYIDFN